MHVHVHVRGCSKAAFGKQADDDAKNHPAGSLAAGTLAPSLLSLSAALDAFEQHMEHMEHMEQDHAPEQGQGEVFEQGEAEAARNAGRTNGGGINGGAAVPAAARLPAAVIGAACAQWAEAHGQQLVQSETQLEEALCSFVEQVGGE
jgi:hypothetical protein